MVLRGMDLPCYTHTFYERPKARSGLRKRCATWSRKAVVDRALKTLEEQLLSVAYNRNDVRTI